MPKLTLYELLGLPSTAGAGEVRSAFRREMSALESRRSELAPQDFRERQQLLQVANDTLSDPILRARYDTELGANRPAGRADLTGSALVNRDQVRADVLGLRADAISLRADAMLARADLDLGMSPGRERSVATGVLNASNIVVRAIGLLFIVGVVAFGITRCAVGGSTDKRAVIEARAAEQVALQDYFQTYGVRPANMAELELMETERRRRENEARQSEQEQRRREDDQRRWEQESRRLAEETSRNLRRADDEARRQAERALQLKFREEELRLEMQLARSESERRRLELKIKQIREQREQH